MHLICFSHLRWNFVYQRPQHLLSRFAKKFITCYIEEFVFTEDKDGYSLTRTPEGVIVVIPHLRINDTSGIEENERLQNVLINLFAERQIEQYIFWYYTPMALAFTEYFKPKLVVFDCMDELSAFKFAPTALKDFEKQLLSLADLVFTGGNSLYEAKKNSNANVFSFPSSIDKEHFQGARYIVQEPNDQANIPYPRLGFFGVIDERFDIALISEAAESQPDWNFVFIGPVVKIDPAILPRANNIFYLGSKSYQELPTYLSGWDIALIPFAINESTRYISPTKTPEYLAAGKPVISTPIADVIEPYETLGLVQVINNSSELINAAQKLLKGESKTEWLASVDDYLSTISWDDTWTDMNLLMRKALKEKVVVANQKHSVYV
jgi:glycosyltransferase involved in cell wall biosynthesis